MSAFPCSDRSNLPILNTWFASADLQVARCWASRGIMRARGSWFAYSRQSGHEIRALAMLHPAFLLRQPAHKRFAWADMRALARALKLGLDMDAQDGATVLDKPHTRLSRRSSPVNALSISYASRPTHRSR